MSNLLNLSGNFSNFVIPSNNKPISIRVSEVIREICPQIDEKILIGLFLILTFYIFSVIIMPISRKFWIQALPNWEDVIKPTFNYLYSALETFSLGGILLIIGFAYYQESITGGFLTWGIILGIVVIGGLYFRWKTRDK